MVEVVVVPKVVEGRTDAGREPVLERKRVLYLDGVLYNDKYGAPRRTTSMNSHDLKHLFDNVDNETGRYNYNIGVEGTNAIISVESGVIRSVVYSSLVVRGINDISIPWKTFVETGKPEKLEEVSQYFVSER